MWPDYYSTRSRRRRTRFWGQHESTCCIFSRVRIIMSSKGKRKRRKRKEEEKKRDEKRNCKTLGDCGVDVTYQLCAPPRTHSTVPAATALQLKTPRMQGSNTHLDSIALMLPTYFPRKRRCPFSQELRADCARRFNPCVQSGITFARLDASRCE